LSCHLIPYPCLNLSVTLTATKQQKAKAAKAASGEYSPPNRLAVWWFVVHLLSIKQTPMHKTNLFGGVYSTPFNIFTGE
jgi:hypothetical protein